MRHCTTKWEDTGSIPDTILGNFQVTYSFFLQSVALGSTQSVTELSAKSKVRPAHRVDKPAVLVVPSVKSHNSISLLSRHDLLRERFYLFYFTENGISARKKILYLRMYRKIIAVYL